MTVERIGSTDFAWLADLNRRIAAGDFASPYAEDPADTAADHPELGYAVCRPIDRRRVEFWDANAGRWRLDWLEFDGPITRRLTPAAGAYTLYASHEAAQAAAGAVDETGTAYIFAVAPPDRPAPPIAQTADRRRF
jgi:hypothetical protein